MSAVTAFVLLLAIAGALGATAWLVVRRRANREMRAAFGSNDLPVEKPEVVEPQAAGVPPRGGAPPPQLRPLGMHEVQEFQSAWRDTRRRFQVDPRSSIIRADVIARRVMRARGVPTHRVETEPTVLSERWPKLLQHYLTAHSVVAPVYDGTATAADLERAMEHYRTFIEAMLRERPPDA
ncbi:MAG: hypothetical protein ACOC97_05860 [Myxococcota bacterium]